MTLSAYLIQLASDKEKKNAIDDRVLYLYDTVNNLYYTKVIHPARIYSDGTVYVFFDMDEPYHDYEKVNLIRAWTVTNAVNCLMGLEALTGNYCESEVD